MKRKTEFIIIGLLILIGSLITFYSCNLLMSDVSNIALCGLRDNYIISSIPMFMIALDFTVALIFIIRFNRYPQYKKALCKLYSTYLIINSSIAVIAAILSGTIVYHSMVAPYPFFAYPLMMLIINLLLIGVTIYSKIKFVKKLPEDTSKRKIKFHYVLYSAMLGGMTFFAFNKFGAFLYSPFYITWRTLDLTFTFYLSLLLPITLVIHVIRYFTDCYVNKSKQAIIYCSIVLGLTIVLCGSVLILGSTYTQFISAVSPALPLERLATKPINSIFMLVVMLIFSGYYLFYAIRTHLGLDHK